METSVANGFCNGRLSFHPIPCGTALFGHVTSGATYTAYSQVGSASHSRSHNFDLVSCLTVGLLQHLGANYMSVSAVDPTLDSCSMGLS